MDDLRRRLHALGLFEMALSGDSASQIGGHVDTHVSPGPREGEASSTASEGLAWKTVEFGDDALGQRRLAQVGPYEMIRPLGAGSFGIVYLALDRRLNRRVAIKVARASVLTDPGLRARFFREAEALARLEHPHIVPVYEADEIDGLCFLALAYCEGPTLEQWFQERDAPLEPRVAARLVLPLVLAVEHAHSRGILHRDIKPGNILLQTSDAGSRKSEIRSQRSEVKSEVGDRTGKRPTSDLRPPTSGPRPPISDLSPKLTDFGLARLMEEKHGETLAGVVLGTAHYMAPEQAAGHIERVGPATDVYSLGAILYQLISGRVPIEGNSTIDTLRRVLIDEPTELNRLVVDVPDDLVLSSASVCRKIPASDMARRLRWPTTFSGFLSGRPTTARPLAPAERFSRWLARHKALVPLLSLAATAVGLSVGLFWYAERLSRSQSLFREAKEQLGQANERAESRALFLAEQAYATDLFAAGKSTSKGDIAHAIEALSPATAGRRATRPARIGMVLLVGLK